MKKAFFFLLSAFLLNAFSAQALTIYGEILNNNNLPLPARVYLKSVSLSGNNTLDSADVNVFGAYTLNKNVNQYGQYYLFVGKINYTVLLSPNEPSIKITNELGDKQKIWIENSPENDAYKIYKEFKSYYEAQIMSTIHSGLPADTIHPKLKMLFGQYFEQLQQVRGFYPNTFTGSVVCKMKQFASTEGLSKQNNTLAFAREHYLDSIDWTNPVQLEELSFDETFMAYVSSISDTTFASFQKFEATLASFKNMDLAIYKYYRRQVFNFFMLVHQEEKLEYFIRQTLADSRIKEVPVLETQMNEVKRVLPGNAYIEVTGFAIDKKLLSLSEELKKSKLTLLVFWEPSCKHCRESMPELSRIYNTYKKKGFSIFAANLSDEEAEWEKIITDNQLEWTNVMMQKELNKRDASSSYFVIYTPTLVLFNKEGKILRRFIGVNELERELQKQLKR
jgi:thiol-disulfide isomerase/thioredoxin